MKIARSLVVLMLIPLAVGLLLRARRPGAASRIRPTIGWISNISMILVVVLTVAGHFKSVLSVFGTFGVLAAVVYTVVCAGIGWLLGGPGTSTRGCWHWGRRRETPPPHSWSPGRTSTTRR